MPNFAGLASQATSALSSTLSQAQSIASNVTGAVQGALNGASQLTGSLGQLGSKLGSSLGLSAFNTKFGVQDFQNGSILKAAPAVSPEDSARDNSVKGGEILRFPADTPKYACIFTFKKYNRPSALETKEEIPTLYVVLPMPSTLSEDYAISYKTPDLGAMVGTASELVQAGIKGDIGVKEAATIAGNALNRNAAAVGVADKAKSVISSTPKLSSFSEALGNGIDRALGAIPNPHQAVIFEKANLREHKFTYRFSPNSEGELKTLKSIIKKIKQRILPRKSGEFVLTFPDTVDVQFEGLAENTILIKTCSVTDFQVNYTPQGAPAFFKTGDPVEVEISISLKENQAHTSEDII